MTREKKKQSEIIEKNSSPASIRFLLVANLCALVLHVSLLASLKISVQLEGIRFSRDDSSRGVTKDSTKATIEMKENRIL